MFKKRDKILAMILLACLVVFPFTKVTGQKETGQKDENNSNILESFSNTSEVGSYGEHLKNYEELLEKDNVIEAQVKETGEFGKDVVRKDDFFLLQDGVDSWVEYEVEVAEEGMFQIVLTYAQTELSTRDMMVDVLINNSFQFKEAKEIVIPRIYMDESEIREDSNGNEIAPKQQKDLDWQAYRLASKTGFYEGPYEFYLNKGVNKVRISSSGMEIKIKEVTFAQQEKVLSYEDYLLSVSGQDTEGHLLKIQAENMNRKTGTLLYPSYDRNNGDTEDSKGNKNSPSRIRINAAGGELWKQNGMWISWTMEVPEDGYYNIGFKFRQNFLDGLFTSRKVYIDDNILFQELERVRFKFNSEWQTMTFANESGEEYKVFLSAGTHEIKMEVTMGDFADSLRRINDCVYDLNNLYLQIVMITSATPDAYTDYMLEEKIPGMLQVIEENQIKLKNELEVITKITGGKGSATSSIDRMQVQLKTLLKEPELIPKRLGSFKNNISALGTWIVDMQDQKLQLDYIYLKSPDVKTPNARGSFLSNVWYSVRRFLASFDSSNEKIGVTQEDGEARSVKIWLNSTIVAPESNGTSAGRDQAQVLRDMVDEMFTPETGIDVEIELVQGSLIEATLAGQGPDVALFTAEDQPVNFAIRGALTDLSQFDGWEEVASRFYSSSITPFEYLGGYYALPDTQMFNMLFYRTDVFEKLGITVPNTWDDFYNILPVIQRNNLQITIQDIFPTLLFQYGGAYYTEDGTKALFGEMEAIEAMKTYTDFFTDYGFPVQTDFYSRFRSGELAMSIQPYNMYNQLIVAAPEINGLWDMVAIPGILKEDGEIDRSASSTVSGTIMLKSAKNKEAAWQFIEWWTRDDVKARYGIQLEGLLGPSARYTPANIKTLEMLPWSDDQFENLSIALSAIKGIPQVPGSYYTTRALQNAFRSVVYNADTPREAMIYQNKLINHEITLKREEFGSNIGTTGGETK